MVYIPFAVGVSCVSYSNKFLNASRTLPVCRISSCRCWLTVTCCDMVLYVTQSHTAIPARSAGETAIETNVSTLN